MIATPALAWVLTAAFVLSGGYALLRWAATMTGPLPPAQRTTELAHLLMSVSMLVMTWAWFGSTGLVVQVALFALFTVYFVVRAVAATRGLTHACTGGAAHALAAGAMVWMLVSMPLIMATPVTTGSGGGHAGHAGHGGGSTDMGGMVMPSAPAGWAVGLTLVLCLALLVASGYWAMRALRRESGSGPAHATSGGAAPADTVPDDTAPGGTAPAYRGPRPDGAPADAPSVDAAPADAPVASASAAVAVADAPAAGTPEHASARTGAFGPIGPRSDAACHAMMCLGMGAMLLAMVAGW